MLSSRCRLAGRYRLSPSVSLCYGLSIATHTKLQHGNKEFS